MKSFCTNRLKIFALPKVDFQRFLREPQMRHSASYYFEWEHLTTDSVKKKTGEKFRIQPEVSSIIFFAGLYRVEEIRFIHDRRR